MLAQLPGIVWTTDTDFKITSIAGGALRYMPVSKDEALGRLVGDLLAPDASQRVACRLGECPAMVAHRRALLGNSSSFQVQNFRLCGRDLDVMVEPLMNSAGKINGCIALAIDRTEGNRVKAADHDRADLEEAVTAMEHVLTIIGHELRTPLAGLRVMAEHLLESGTEHDDISRRNFLTSIHAEVKRISHMINDLLDAAQVSPTLTKWQYSRISLSEVCSDALQSIKHLIDHDRITIECEVVPPDLTIRADITSIRRLLGNLLSNAQRHTSDGRIALRATRIDERYIEIVVADTGEGIAERLSDKLGVPFALNAGVIGGSMGARHSENTGNQPNLSVIGSGLGLAICNRIAAAHGGSMRIDSTPSRGTTATIRLRADLDRHGLADA